MSTSVNNEIKYVILSDLHFGDEKSLLNKFKYIFCWDNISIKEKKRLTDLLKVEYNISFKNDAYINKLDYHTIVLSEKDNISYEKIMLDNRNIREKTIIRRDDKRNNREKTIILKLDDKKKQVFLEINGIIKKQFYVKSDNGKLKIYEFDQSEVMECLINCLESLLKDQARPTLILNGDILDLALGEIGASSMIFDKFMQGIMGYKVLFGNEIIFIPGNHDHHIWEIARETQYGDDIKGSNLSEFPEPRHNTGMIPGTHLDECNFFLPSLINRHRRYREKEEMQPVIPGKNRQLKKSLKKSLFSKDLKIRISYPNYIIRSVDNGMENRRCKRCAILHHGHFTEPPYYLISYLNYILTNAEFPSDLDTLERENFAWIDFMWSTLGRSGAAGDTVKRIWEVINNPNKLGDISKEIQSNFTKKTNKSGLIMMPRNVFKNKIIKDFFKLFDTFLPVIQFITNTRNRKSTIKMDDEDLKARLSQFLKLSWPQARDALHYDPNVIPELVFIYGHTHKPDERFEKLQIENGNTNKVPVVVHNTGGWVVDRAEPNPDIGASIVLMNDRLDAVSLKIYKEEQKSFEELNKHLLNMDDDSIFKGYISKKIKTSPGCWEDLTKCANLVREEKVKSINMD